MQDIIITGKDPSMGGEHVFFIVFGCTFELLDVAGDEGQEEEDEEKHLRGN